ERKYKKVPGDGKKRAHSYKEDGGTVKRNTKERPLHYANHFDALIMAYYADKLQRLYEDHLSKSEALNKCITAYRKISVEGDSTKNKGNIHFAKEVFDEIKLRSTEGNEVVVM